MAPPTRGRPQKKEIPATPLSGVNKNSSSVTPSSLPSSRTDRKSSEAGTPPAADLSSAGTHPSAWNKTDTLSVKDQISALNLQVQTVKENNAKILTTLEESLKTKKIFDKNLMKSFHDIGVSSNNVNKELVAHKTSVHELLRSQALNLQRSTDDLDRSLQIALQNQAKAKIQNDLALARLD